MDDNDIKNEAAECWFEDQINKIRRLATLSSNGRNLNGTSWEEEAFILCIVYLDRLSNRVKFTEKTSSKERFCKLLLDYSGNESFSKITLRQLLRNLKKKHTLPIAYKIICYFNSLDCDLDTEMYCKKEPHQEESYFKLYTEQELNFFLKNSISLTEAELSVLSTELWRGSVASVCFEFVRCSTVHEYTQEGLNVGGYKLDFNVLYSALEISFAYFKKHYDETGKFFNQDVNEHLFSL